MSSVPIPRFVPPKPPVIAPGHTAGSITDKIAAVVLEKTPRWFYLAFGAFIIVGAGNAVNLTDGLDGLAIVPVMIAAASFGMIAYLVGNAVFSEYLQIRYVAGTGELAVLCGAVLGAGLSLINFGIDEVADPRLRSEPKIKVPKLKKAVA